MRKLTIIRGKRGCGKTTEMIKMIEGKNVLILNPFYDRESSFFFNDLTDDIDVIVFEECSSEQLLKVVNQHFRFDEIHVNRKYKTRIRVKTPDFIIIMQSR